MINIYIVMFNIEGKKKLKRFFIHASDIEDAEKFAYKKWFCQWFYQPSSGYKRNCYR